MFSPREDILLCAPLCISNVSIIAQLNSFSLSVHKRENIAGIFITAERARQSVGQEMFARKALDKYESWTPGFCSCTRHRSISTHFKLF
jgi:hypothetical protein